MKSRPATCRARSCHRALRASSAGSAVGERARSSGSQDLRSRGVALRRRSHLDAVRAAERGEQQRACLDAVERALIAQHAQLVDVRIAQQRVQPSWIAHGAGDLGERQDPFLRGGRDGRPVEREVDGQAHIAVKLYGR